MTDQATNPVVDDGARLDDAGVDLNHDLIDGADLNDGLDGALDLDSEGDGQPDAADPVEDDHEEIEWEDGKKYRIPKALKAGILRQADYTRKTQEVAQAKREASERVARFEQAGEELVQAKAALLTIDNRLKQIDGLTEAEWQRLEANGQASSLEREARKLRDQRDQVNSAVASRTSQLTEEQERENANLRAAMFEEVKQVIPTWTDEVADEVANVGVGHYGLTPDDLRNLVHAPSLRILHDAVQGRKAIEELRALKSAAKRQSTAPATTLRGQGGRFAAKPETNDFAAFEKLADEALASKK